MSCGAGVDVEQVAFFVVHNAQYVRVSGHEDVGFLFVEERQHKTVVVTRVAADVCHQHFGAFAVEELVLGNLVAQVVAVAVAKHSRHGFEILQSVVGGEVADVTGMPKIIAVLEKSEYLFRYKSVCVR